MKYILIPLLTIFLLQIKSYSQDNQPNKYSIEDNLHHFEDLMEELKQENFYLSLENKTNLKKANYSFQSCTFEEAIRLIRNKEILKLRHLACNHNYTKEELRVALNEIQQVIDNKLLDSTYLLTLFEKNKFDLEMFEGNGGVNKVQAACTNMDFAAGNTSGWNCSWGKGEINQIKLPNGNVKNNPVLNTGPNAGVVNTPANAATPGFHTIMTGGTDPLVPIPVIPPSGGKSLRLGNSQTAPPLTAANGFKAQRIKQTFQVNASNPNFIYQYAVVVDHTKDHDTVIQPYFQIRMYDMNNNVIDCASYDVNGITSHSIGGFDSVIIDNKESFRYKNWSTVTIPLDAYINQNVTIEFTTSDCTRGGHFCYAYIQCLCAPIPIITSSPIVCLTQTVTLVAPSGAASYTWTGSGTPSSINSATTTVNVGGTYTVSMSTLSVPPQIPCIYTSTIALGMPPNIAIPNFIGQTLCVNTPLTFTNSTVDPTITQYTWNFGDGSPPLITITATNPVHTYTTPGTFTVTLTAFNGCTSVFSKIVTISPPPIIAFTSDIVCKGTVTNFTNTSSVAAPDNITSWSWDFDNNGTTDDSNQNPSHLFGSINTVTVELKATTLLGCRDSLLLPVNFAPNPTIAFTAPVVCIGNVTNFTNTSSVVGSNTITTWAWDFNNDGITDDATLNPSHTFSPVATYPVKLTGTTNYGCKDSLTVMISVSPLPIPNFSTKDACMNTNVVLNNTSTPLNLPYNWYFGANATPLTSTVSFPTSLMYSTSGVKTITLTINANTTCSASITQTVTIFLDPVANFSVPSVCQSTASVYTDLSTPTGSISAWQWDFTDDGVIDDQTGTPTYVFPTAGTYTTSLIVKSSDGCLDTIKLPLDVWGHAIPDFIANPVCFNTATTFTNTTDLTTNTNIGTTPTYTWDFADGTGAIILAGNPTHNYLLGGNANATYQVTLTVSTSHNCVDSITKTINVYANPTASFTSDSVCLGSPSHMLDASNGNGNTVNGFIWDFLSNGTIDATISNPAFTFPSVGSNAVSYTVTSSPVAGLTCKNVTTTITVWVNPIPVPSFTFVNKCINAQPNTFDASSSSISVGTNASYTWAFGDGGTSLTNIAPTHTYAAAGLYTTTLTVTSDKGCKATIAKQVEVYQKPLMSFVNSPACDKTAITFTAVSLPNSGAVTTWNWDFNNTITTFEGTGANSSFIFPTAGSHTVALVTVTSNGCVDTIFKPIYVNYIPVPLFKVDDPDGCPVHCVTFSDLSTPLTGLDKITQWQWSLGDGSTDVINTTNADVKHCYTNTSHNQLALFDIKLTVTTIAGCTNSINKQSFITVFPTPIAKYDISPNPGSVIDPTEYFNNQSSDYVKWWWTFGDGPIKSDSINKNPKHVYPEINETIIYNTKLLVMNQYGCIAEAEEPVQIDPMWTFYIPNCFTPNNEDGKNDFFTGFGIGIDYFEMWIFDRWGANIFYTNDMTKGWNGKVHNYSEEGKQDVYTWKVKIKDVFGKNHSYVGHVTILK